MSLEAATKWLQNVGSFRCQKSSFSSNNHPQWIVYITTDDRKSIGVGLAAKDKYNNYWTAYVYPQPHLIDEDSPAAFEQWSRENHPTQETNFRTRRDAALWIIERSKKIGNIYYEFMNMLSPLERLVEETKDVI